MGAIRVDFSASSGTFTFPFQVARDINPPLIIGWDFLLHYQAQVDLTVGALITDLTCIPLLQPHQLTPLVCNAVVSVDIEVPAWSEMTVPLALADSPYAATPHNYEGVLEPSSHSPVIVACTLASAHEGTIPVRISNPTSSVVTLHSGMLMGEFHSLIGREGECYCAVTKPNGTTHDPLNSTPTMDPTSPIDLSGSNLTPDERQHVEALIHDYADIFSQHADDYGRTNFISHTIPTGNAQPIRQRAYRASPTIRQEIKKQCDTLLDAGVIEPSSSPWSSPVVMVKKKTGGYRFCVDYRKLNQATTPDSHPLPRIDDTIDALAGNSYFSTMDLSSGYWQVTMDQRDSPKTAFTTGSDLYQFKVMPMGLRNAPSTFQRLMQLVLRGLHWESVLVYLDDVIVFGRSFDEKLDRLRVVFDRLRSAGIKLRPEKCHFFHEKVTFLGHVISTQGILPDLANVAKVREWPTPHNVTDVRAFLGLCGYYRRFVKSFAKIAHPLFQLTTKGTPFVWSDDCQHAFVSLRQALTNPPIMAFPVYTEPFQLHTDASNVAVGGGGGSSLSSRAVRSALLLMRAMPCQKRNVDGLHTTENSGPSFGQSVITNNTSKQSRSQSLLTTNH